MQLSLTFTTLALALAAGNAFAAPSHLDPRAMLVKESVQTPRGWIRRGPAADATLIPLSIALKRNDIAGLEAELLRRSDPNGPAYLQHMTREEVLERMAPSVESANAVRRWLAEHGVEEDVQRRSVAGDYVRATVSVAKARSMLGADFAEYLNERSGESVVRAVEYSLPRDIFDHVDLVGPTTYFSKPVAHRAPIANVEMLPADFKPSVADVIIGNARIASDAQAIPAVCANTSTTKLECIRELYGTASYKVQTQSQLIGISGFLEEFPNKADLQQFETTERPDVLGYTYDLVSIANGGNDQSIPGVEANLDVQTVAAIAGPIKSTYYSTGGSPPFIPDINTPTNTNEPYTSELEYLLTLPKNKLPTVLSTSYGDDEQTIPQAYAIRVCAEIAALTARGVTYVVSSGDFGVGADGTCVSNDGKNTTQFLPAFPAGCPWSTTIGGTEGYGPNEEAVSDAIGGFFGGAGFSNLFPAPLYQRKTVDAYVKSLGKLYKGLYNPKGRAYPDLAAQASRYLIVIGGRYGRVGGTSASAPTTASIIALLNDARAAIGKPNLGFLNPLLYSGFGAKNLVDITKGSSAGCDTDGFPAKAGWDAVTGFGTPANFPKLLAAALKV